MQVEGEDRSPVVAAKQSADQPRGGCFNTRSAASMAAWRCSSSLFFFNRSFSFLSLRSTEDSRGGGGFFSSATAVHSSNLRWRVQPRGRQKRNISWLFCYRLRPCRYTAAAFR